MDPTQEQAERLRQMFGGTPGAAQYLQPNIGNLLGRMGQQGPQMIGPRQSAPQPPPRPPGPQMAGPQAGQPTPQPNVGALLGQMARPPVSPQQYQGGIPAGPPPPTPRPDTGGLLGQMGAGAPPTADAQGPAGAYGGGAPTQQPLTPPPTVQPPINAIDKPPQPPQPGGPPKPPFVQGPPQPPEPGNPLFQAMLQSMVARSPAYYQPRQSGRPLLPKGYEGIQ